MHKPTKEIPREILLASMKSSSVVSNSQIKPSYFSLEDLKAGKRRTTLNKVEHRTLRSTNCKRQAVLDLFSLMTSKSSLNLLFIPAPSAVPRTDCETEYWHISVFVFAACRHECASPRCVCS